MRQGRDALAGLERLRQQDLAAGAAAEAAQQPEGGPGEQPAPGPAQHAPVEAEVLEPADHAGGRRASSGHQ